MCTNTGYLNFHITLILYMPTYTKLKLLEDLTYDTFTKEILPIYDS